MLNGLRRRNRGGEEYKYNEKMAINKYLSKITLKVSGLDALIKRYRVVE